ncbi:MAG: hypothetical protein KJ709_04640 [Nanoarchaeota archaeon]|nr:hypothetical protein [Nanoarchaeota archaeon]
MIEGLFNEMELCDLLAIRKELLNGAPVIKQALDNRIRQEKKKHEKTCSVCQSTIDPASASSYTLIFGPEDFMKKASFCAVDCLEYFLKRKINVRDR